MRYTILDQKIDGKNLPRHVRVGIIAAKVKKVSWVAQVALIAVIVDVALRIML